MGRELNHVNHGLNIVDNTIENNSKKQESSKLDPKLLNWKKKSIKNVTLQSRYM